MAYQRLVDDVVLAMLPMQTGVYGVVYTANQTTITHLMQLDDVALLTKLQQQFGYRLGRLTQLGQRFTYPLKMILAKQQTQAGFLLLGNAAHNITPIAAQGFNLALQDIYCLSQLVSQYPHNYARVLNEYQQQREPEQQRVIDFTDRLMRWSKTNTTSALLKSTALMALDLAPTLKRHLIQLGMGLTPQIQLLMRACHET
jgi:2-octaprenyl-6-methoxyphenol hydroxylase